MSSEPITDKPVCVTGASGFIASRLVADLLNKGYSVRGTVRDASAKERYAMLTELPGAERLELVSADLLEEESFEAAISGCQYVMHTASPYVITVRDPDAGLVQPAVRGTLAVLEAATKVGGVSRVVLTSSVAAINDEPETDTVLTEEHWNEKSSLTRNPYYFSKAKAERAAWDYMKRESPDFDLVVINPGLVIGPSLVPSLNASNEVIANLLNGKTPAIVSLTWGIVDVRDVSSAHILAMEIPEAKGRYLCANQTISMRELVEMLKDLGYSGYKLPKLGLDGGVGTRFAKMASVFQPKGVRSYLKTNLGRVLNFDNSKIKRELGLSFRDPRSSVGDAVEDMKTWKHVV